MVVGDGGCSGGGGCSCGGGDGGGGGSGGHGGGGSCISGGDGGGGGSGDGGGGGPPPSLLRQDLPPNWDFSGLVRLADQQVPGNPVSTPPGLRS